MRDRSTFADPGMPACANFAIVAGFFEPRTIRSRLKIADLR
jgi:hypothetical protein